MDIFPLEIILGHYNLSPAQYEVLRQDARFQNFYDQFAKEWSSALSTPQRLKLQAAAYLEANLPKVAARMINNVEDLGKVNEVAKTLAKIAGVGEDTNKNSNPGEKFQININLGADQTVQIEKTINGKSTGAEAANAAALLTDGQGEGDAAPLRDIPKGSDLQGSIFEIPTGDSQE